MSNSKCPSNIKENKDGPKSIVLLIGPYDYGLEPIFNWAQMGTITRSFQPGPSRRERKKEYLYTKVKPFEALKTLPPLHRLLRLPRQAKGKKWR